MADSKTLSLNISERLYAIAVLNTFGKGDFEFVGQAIEDVKQLSVSEEEWKSVERVEEKVKNEKGEEIEQKRWNAEKDKETIKEVTFQGKVWECILSVLEEKNKKGEFTLGHEGVALVSLYKKLKG